MSAFAWVAVVVFGLGIAVAVGIQVRHAWRMTRRPPGHPRD